MILPRGTWTQQNKDIFLTKSTASLFIKSPTMRVTVFEGSSFIAKHVRNLLMVHVIVEETFI